MTPEFYHRQAMRCRRLAAEQLNSEKAAHLLAQANDHETAAVLMTELSKINAVLAPAKKARAALRAAS
jgi:hypothetical protein